MTTSNPLNRLPYWKALEEIADQLERGERVDNRSRYYGIPILDILRASAETIISDGRPVLRKTVGISTFVRQEFSVDSPEPVLVPSVVVSCDDGTAWIYDEAGGRWEEIAPIPGTRAAAGEAEE